MAIRILHTAGLAYVRSGLVEVGADSYPATYDPDATTFLTATGIPNDSTSYYSGGFVRTGAQIWSAVNQRVVSLKSQNLWSLVVADYPFVGNSASACKLNVKNPLDTDAACRLSFLGTGNSFATGYSGTGTGWANTFLAPSALSQNNVTVSAYVRTARDAEEIIVGAANSDLSNSLYLLPQFANTNYSRINNGNTGPFGTGVSTGMQTAVRTGATARAYYRNGTQTVADSAGSATAATVPLFIGALNQAGTANYKAIHQLGAVTIFNVGLSAAQVTAFYGIELAFQTAMGRNV